DRRRQRERSRERAITALDAMELLSRDFRVDLLLATERKRVAFNRHFDLLFPDVRQLGLQYQLVLAVAVNVDRRHPSAAGEDFLRGAAEAQEHPAHPFLGRG